ncbi:hypothetical protein [Marinicella sp. W31]|uniref:hypothetical protein n=1 Tax=Marinicella sp. W31 TaxID=3023713 RepID=UPI003756F463
MLKSVMLQNRPDLEPSIDVYQGKLKLKRWPDFGLHGYKIEYLKLTTLLLANDLTYQQIKSATGFTDEIIDSFLMLVYKLDILNSRSSKN